MQNFFYEPRFFHKILAILLLPFTVIYFFIIALQDLRRLFRPKIFKIPIISIGNLVLGGSGKTPVVCGLCEHFSDKKVAVILRGYRRKSRGVMVVKNFSQILKNNVEETGDEAQMIARRFLGREIAVIVAENRGAGVLLAQNLGAEIVILDDGFRFHFKKFNVLLRPKIEPFFNFLLPSGAYREPKSRYERADCVLCEKDFWQKDGDFFIRRVILQNFCYKKKYILASAIANPERLEKYVTKCNIIKKIYFMDHAFFDENLLRKELSKLGADGILCTEKDAVKIQDLPLCVMRLEIDFSKNFLRKIDAYVTKSNT